MVLLTAGKSPLLLRLCSAVVLAGILAHGLSAQGAPPAASPAEPKMIGDSTIPVDRKTGAAKSGISLQNASDADLRILVTPLINPDKPSKIQVHIAKDKTTDNADPIDLTLTPGAVQPLWINVKDAWAPGDTSVDLMDRDKKIGTIKIRVLPVTLKLDGPTPEKADLALFKCTESHIILKNEDSDNYSLDWNIFLDGHIVCEGTGVPVHASGYGLLICRPKNVPFRFRHLLKDETLNGTLYVRDTGSTSPLKTFPVSASLYSLRPGSRSFLRYCIIFLFLAMGGILSLILNQTLPNRIQKLNLQERLAAIAKSNADLSTRLDSRLGVLVRIEWTRLRVLLNSRSTIFPEFAGVAKLADDGLNTLTKRVKLLQQMELVMDRLGKVRPHGVPPSLIEQVNLKLGTAIALLGKRDCADEDLQSAKLALDGASSLVESLKNPGADFGQDLLQRIKAVVEDIQKNFESKQAFKDLNDAVPGPWGTIKQFPANIVPDMYESLDMALERVKLMREYTVLEAGTKDHHRLQRLGQKKSRLTSWLELDSWEALNSAKLLMREMKEDIYPDRMIEALRDGQANIHMDPAIAYDRAPLTFNIHFYKRELNDASAREEWSCNWEFGDKLKGNGWEVSHYFDLGRLNAQAAKPEAKSQKGGSKLEEANATIGAAFLDENSKKVDKPGATDPLKPEAKPKKPGSKLEAANVTITATFLDENGKKVNRPGTADPLKVELTVKINPSEKSKLWGRTLTEAMKLGAALLIAIFGLVAGAGDQLSKLDVLPGLVAVFLLGFGADAIKNVLSAK